MIFTVDLTVIFQNEAMSRRVLNSGTCCPKELHFELLDPEYEGNTHFIKYETLYQSILS